MKIKALKSFSGLVAMTQGEERDVRDAIAEDLIGAGYAESAEAAKPAENAAKKPAAKK